MSLHKVANTRIFHDGAETCRKYHSFQFVWTSGRCLNVPHLILSGFNEAEGWTLWKRGKTCGFWGECAVFRLYAPFILCPSLYALQALKNHFRIDQAFHVSAFHFLKVSFLTISCVICCDRRCQTQWRSRRSRRLSSSPTTNLWAFSLPVTFARELFPPKMFLAYGRSVHVRFAYLSP